MAKSKKNQSNELNKTPNPGQYTGDDPLNYNYEILAQEIMRQAAFDYRLILWLTRKSKKLSVMNQRTLNELEMFFTSEECALYSHDLGIYIRDKIREEISNGILRKGVKIVESK